MTQKRSTDPTPVTPFRSDRISLINGRYFFDTREGVLKGPYSSRQEAQQAVDEYIRRRQKLGREKPAEPVKNA